VLGLVLLQSRYRSCILPALLCVDRLVAKSLGPVRRRLGDMGDVEVDGAACLALMKEVRGFVGWGTGLPRSSLLSSRYQRVGVCGGGGVGDGAE